MAFFDRFTKRWASTGVVTEPTDGQAAAGFAHLGSNPPTVEEFNALFQWNDDKDNFLFGQQAAVIQAAGTAPSPSDPNQLLSAVRYLLPRNIQAFPSVGVSTWTVPAGVTRVYGDVVGGGGGGGGTSNGGASGGCGGGRARGWFDVAPGQVLTITVGAGGTAGTGTPTAGGNGGSSAIGGYMTATGGRGGDGAAGGNGAPVNSTPGSGTGGQINEAGNIAAAGFTLAGVPLGSAGGSAPGGSLIAGVSPSTGNGASYPGGGGGGAGGATFAAGAAGAAGRVILMW